MSDKVPVVEDESDTVLWVTEFDEEKSKLFAEKLFQKAAPDHKRPLIIYIDSYGGSVDGLATMYSAMDAVKNPLITCCMGKAMSTGAMLLSYGDTRYVQPHSRIMIHEVSAGAWGNINDLKNSTKQMDALNDYWMEKLAANCGMSKKDLLKNFTNERRDFYMTGAEAVKFGLADKVGSPRIKTVTKYKVIDT